MRRLVPLLALLALMGFYRRLDPMSAGDPVGHATVSLGFVLLAAYVIGHATERIGLPRLTGYILAGVVFGPFGMVLLSPGDVRLLRFIDDLALSLIAFAAGGHLIWRNLAKRSRLIILLIAVQTVIMFCGVAVSVMLLRPLLRAFLPPSFAAALAASLLLGVICVARSPSSALAIISEMRASGPYTDVILSVTVAIDVIVIVLFTAVVSVVEGPLLAGHGVEITVLSSLLAELAMAIGIGCLLGYVITFLADRIAMDLAIILSGMGLLVIKIARVLPQLMEDHIGSSLHLEPLLICMTAGLFVTNFSRHEPRFLKTLERVSMPVFAVFFALAGAQIDLGVLRSAWAGALWIVALRAFFLLASSHVGARLGRCTPERQNKLWLGFLTQAGVGLGLAAELSRRFPDWGPQVATIVLAAIAINQLAGPVAFKYALIATGEGQRPRRITVQRALEKLLKMS